MPKSKKSPAQTPCEVTTVEPKTVREDGSPAVKSKSDQLKDRLFNIRMKINQGRKSNKAEVEEEYKRFSDPKYEQRQRYLIKQNAGLGNSGGDGPGHQDGKGEIFLHQTAEQAEIAMERAEEKERNVATFGWHAFTTEATHRAYEKRLKKLPTHGNTPKSSATSSSSSSSASSGVAGKAIGSSVLEADPLAYGTVGAAVGAAGLDRLSKDVEDRQAARTKFSKRRMGTDSADVDYINDKNAAYNKKLKRAFDKYTVEIRQNLERGTAI